MSVTPLFVRYSQLKLGDASAVMKNFQCEATSVGITSEGGGTQSLTTLCPEGSFSEVQPKTYALSVTLAEDYENIESFLFYLIQHDGETQDFIYYPKTDNNGKPVGHGFKGRVTVVSPDSFGGAESGNYSTSSVTLPLVGKYAIIDKDGNLVFDPNDLSNADAAMKAAAAVADLATLKADGTLGDGNFTGTFQSGQYIKLGDDSRAHYTAGAWAAGPMP